MAERKRGRVADPVRAKKDINFDTYVAPKEGSRINWFEQAKVITDAVSGVAKDRTTRKAALQTEYDDAVTEINEIENYDSQTMQDMAIDGVNESANVMYDAKQELENGRMRPADYSKFVNNIRSGQTMFRKLAGEWQTDFKRYTERMQGTSESGQSSTLEQYIGKRMESFGNLEGMRVVTNPKTGNLAFARFEDGVLLTGADDLISMQRMTAISKQEINEVDVGSSIKEAVTEIGDFITASNAGGDGSGPRSVMTIKDFMQTPEAETVLLDKARSVLKDNNSIGSVLADNNVNNKYGEPFTAGTQIDFDDWLSNNEDKTADENPIIIMGYRENGVNIIPEITDRQKATAEEYMVRGYKAALGYEEELETKQVVRENPPSNYKLASDKQEKTYSNLVDVVDKLISGDPTTSSAAATELTTSINSRMSGKKDYVSVQKIERVGDQFVITRKGEEPIVIEAIVDGVELTGDEIGSGIWNVVTGGEVSFSDAKGTKVLGDKGKGDASGTRTSTTTIETPDYNSKIRIDGSDKSIKSAISSIDDIGYDSLEDAASQYSKVFKEVFTMPTTPGIKEAFNGEEINVSADGTSLVFNIGDSSFKYPDDMEGFEDGMLASDAKWDENTDIWPAMQAFIKKTIAEKKTGKKTKTGGVDAFGNPI